MKITNATKKNHTYCLLTYLDNGEIFCPRADYERIPHDSLNYYIVAERNGHKMYISLKDGTDRPFDEHTPVYLIDAELMIYGIKEVRN